MRKKNNQTKYSTIALFMLLIMIITTVLYSCKSTAQITEEPPVEVPLTDQGKQNIASSKELDRRSWLDLLGIQVQEDLSSFELEEIINENARSPEDVSVIDNGENISLSPVSNTEEQPGNTTEEMDESALNYTPEEVEEIIEPELPIREVPSGEGYNVVPDDANQTGLTGDSNTWFSGEINNNINLGEDYGTEPLPDGSVTIYQPVEEVEQRDTMDPSVINEIAAIHEDIQSEKINPIIKFFTNNTGKIIFAALAIFAFFILLNLLSFVSSGEEKKGNSILLKLKKQPKDDKETHIVAPQGKAEDISRISITLGDDDAPEDYDIDRKEAMMEQDDEEDYIEDEGIDTETPPRPGEEKYTDIFDLS